MFSLSSIQLIITFRGIQKISVFNINSINSQAYINNSLHFQIPNLELNVPQDPTNSTAAAPYKKSHRRSRSWGLQTPPALPPTEEVSDPLTLLSPLSPTDEISNPLYHLNLSTPAQQASKSPKVFSKFPSFGKGKKKKKKGHARSLSWGANKDPVPDSAPDTPAPLTEPRMLSPNVDSGISVSSVENGVRGESPPNKELNLSVSITPPTPEKRNKS